jgi:2,4-dienoyl-CoA reductase-like NADH-dependent reductase (Old Yellow Enzyme family)
MAQFLSPKTNVQTDKFGGTPPKHTKIVLRIIKGTRAATSSQFYVGIKMNSVNISEQGNSSLNAGLEQMGLVIKAGINFIEISGRSFENFSFLEVDPPTVVLLTRKKRTI